MRSAWPQSYAAASQMAQQTAGAVRGCGWNKNNHGSTHLVALLHGDSGQSLGQLCDGDWVETGCAREESQGKPPRCAAKSGNEPGIIAAFGVAKAEGRATCGSSSLDLVHDTGLQKRLWEQPGRTRRSAAQGPAVATRFPTC